MRRREFITLASSAAIAWPLAARAQQPAVPVIGFMSTRSPENSSHLTEAFRRGPVEAGFVASLSRPDGNLTGISALQAEIGPKRLQLLLEVVPKATKIALLVNPNNVAVTEKLARDAETGALSLGLEIHVLR